MQTWLNPLQQVVLSTKTKLIMLVALPCTALVQSISLMPSSCYFLALRFIKRSGMSERNQKLLCILQRESSSRSIAPDQGQTVVHQESVSMSGTLQNDGVSHYSPFSTTRCYCSIFACLF